MNKYSVSEKINVFRRELSFINDERIRLLSMQLISSIPNYFFEVSASSTNKYHPVYALGNGGLVRHTKACCAFAIALRAIDAYQLTSIEYDLAIAALLLHDSRKYGATDETKHDYTCFEHPLLAAYAIQHEFDFNDDLLTHDDDIKFIKYSCDIIAHAISSHMGKYNTSTHNKTILPLPQSKIQQFVHTCDYLASRKEFNVLNLN